MSIKILSMGRTPHKAVCPLTKTSTYCRLSFTQAHIQNPDAKIKITTAGTPDLLLGIQRKLQEISYNNKCTNVKILFDFHLLLYIYLLGANPAPTKYTPSIESIEIWTNILVKLRPIEFTGNTLRKIWNISSHLAKYTCTPAY